MNTKFYHRSTIVRRNQGRIKLLKIHGEWVSDFHVLTNHITNYFKCLIDRSQTEDDLDSSLFEGRPIDATHAARLVRCTSMEEVRKAVFGIKRFGSPGPDVIQVVFY